MKKITSLTPEQIAAIPAWREKWINIGLSTRPADWNKFESAVQQCYAASKLKPFTRLIIVDSPLVGSLISGLLSSDKLNDQIGQVFAHVNARVRAQVLEQVRDQVNDQVYAQVSYQVSDQVYAQVHDRVNAQVSYQVNDQVRDQVNDQVYAQVSYQVSDQVYAQVYEQVNAQVFAQVREQVNAQVNDRVREQVRDQLFAQVREQVFAQVREQVFAQVNDRVLDQVNDQIGRVHAQLYAQLYAQVSNQVCAQVRDQVRDRVRARVYDQVSQTFAQMDSQEIAQIKSNALNYVGGRMWAGWSAWKSFFLDLCQLPIESKLAAEAFRDANTEAWWWWPHRGFVVACKPPHTLKRDENNRLHSDNGPAIAWEGWELWYFHGVVVDEQIINQPHTQTINQIRNESNSEVRRIRIERFGWERWLTETNASIIDQRRNDIDNTEEVLMESADDGRVLVCACPSTARVYSMAVPQTITSCIEAQRWMNCGDNPKRRIIGAS